MHRKMRIGWMLIIAFNTLIGAYIAGVLSNSDLAWTIFGGVVGFLLTVASLLLSTIDK